MCFHAELAIGVGPDGHIWTKVLDSEAHSINFLMIVLMGVFLFLYVQVLNWHLNHSVIWRQLDLIQNNPSGAKKEFVWINLSKARRTVCSRNRDRLEWRSSPSPHGRHMAQGHEFLLSQPFSHFFCCAHSRVVGFPPTLLLFSIYLQLYWQCKCKPSCDSYRRPSGKAFVQSCGKRNAELLNLFCMLWKKKKKVRRDDAVVEDDDDDAGNGNIVVLQKEKKYKKY